MALSPIEVQKALLGASYPASRDELVRLAEGNGNTEVAEALRTADKSRFSGPDDVMEALKGRLGGS
jgi:hypothetical protein